MPIPPISGSDHNATSASATNASAPGGVRAQAEDRSFETDFSSLAARFLSRSGGGLSPELAADLALEIVLHEIVEQACLATGATGAAIVLQRDGELMCRARSGKTAPELGSPLAAAAGLSAECIRTRIAQRCDDVEADSRADVEASRRLGVLSLLVLPLLQGDELAGVFEIFSSRTYAFGEREERALEALAHRTLLNLQLAAEPLQAPDEPEADLPEADVRGEELMEYSAEDSVSEIVPVVPPRGVSRESSLWAMAVMASAALLAVALIVPRIGRRSGPSADIFPVSASRVEGAAVPAEQTSAANANSSAANFSASDLSDVKPVRAAVRESAVRETNDADLIPAGSLTVYAEGKEVFHMPPARAQSQADEAEQGTAVPRAVSDKTERIVDLSPAGAAGNSAIVLKSVAPEYPADALRRQVQGAVVLDVRIGSSGEVQSASAVSGAAMLTKSAVDAVKQWRFQPRVVDGRAVETQTRVTLQFRLPQ